ncbi:hypothetical protein [Frankia sp. R82]|uniref:hypothetical protein n=1 Tax=Frankia sp. R82 TaxID=2950553 RepID=UPI002043DA5A|nr:hypothetical protein [Frankia sp. R82]
MASQACEQVRVVLAPPEALIQWRGKIAGGPVDASPKDELAAAGATPGQMRSEQVLASIERDKPTAPRRVVDAVRAAEGLVTPGGRTL